MAAFIPSARNAGFFKREKWFAYSRSWLGICWGRLAATIQANIALDRVH
jgi:hypothetical protein